MDSGEEDDFVGLEGTPPEIQEAAAAATANLMPQKSKKQYERQYKLFINWRQEKQTESFSENVLLAYIQQLSTRHCLRRSSATLLVDAGADITALKRHGGWRSTTVAETYIDHSLNNKIQTANKISNITQSESSNIIQSESSNIIQSESFDIENTVDKNMNLEFSNRKLSRRSKSRIDRAPVLGPTQRNIPYDDALRPELPREATLTSYADDLAQVVKEKCTKDLSTTCRPMGSFRVSMEVYDSLTTPRDGDTVVVLGPQPAKEQPVATLLAARHPKMMKYLEVKSLSYAVVSTERTKNRQMYFALEEIKEAVKISRLRVMLPTKVKPIYYRQLLDIVFGRTQTSKEEQRYHSFESDTLAVVNSLKQIWSYLLGLSTFKVVTDSNAIKTTLTKRDLVPQIRRRWLQTLEFNFTVEYRPGKKKCHVDTLSRNQVEPPSNVDDIDLLRVELSEEDWILTRSDAERSLQIHCSTIEVDIEKNSKFW
ncbi:hypothetical protein TcasGA2_TC010275 [Tribolium castaneum]|uniref:Reverse transcriptase RNase H-like domain-containing protein n=1 Tax=Tribolium castaneum TaxID=7070 RepID=D7EJK0_TRICA|nr:hypothetical protein TcasGA2_TC010275 [Tribolium castaneum]